MSFWSNLDLFTRKCICEELIALNDNTDSISPNSGRKPPLVGNLALNKGGVFEGFGDLARFGSKFFARLRRAFPLCIPIFARRRREKISFSRHFPLQNIVFRVFFRARLRRALIFEIPLLYSTND